MLVYRTGRRGSGEFSAWSTLADTEPLLWEKLQDKDPFRSKLEGEEWPTRWLGLPGTKRKVHTLAVDLREDQRVWVQTSRNSVYVLQAGQLHLEAAPPLPPVTHTRAIEQVWKFVFAEVQRQEVLLGRRLRVISMGIFNCRKILDSAAWSQHAFGNGFDFVVMSEGAQDDEATTAICRKLAEKGYVAQVLWGGKNLMTGNAVYDHRDHAHISGAPMKTGTPPCA